MQDLKKMTIAQLREMAKTLGLKKYEKLKKAELYELVLATVNPDGKKETKAKTKEKPKTKKPAIDDYDALDSGKIAEGVIEVMQDGFAFIRSDNYLSGEEDIYISPSQVKRYRLRTGDWVKCKVRVRTGNEKYEALHEVISLNDISPEEAAKCVRFEKLTPVFSNERIHLETIGGKPSMRIIDLVSPIGKGQRGMIVSPPKAGKTTLIKDIASSISKNHPDIKLIILLIDERPEEVTDIKDSLMGKDVEVVSSTFDYPPENHKKIADMVINRAKRLVETGRDVVILLDSITRLSRANNLIVTPSGRTLSGGLDPAALYFPKHFFGAARNIREGGSLTILATALVETGSRMDDMIFEEFKGTGNMELVLDRRLAERRIFPAIDILKSGTRREDLLLSEEEYDTMEMIRRGVSNMKPEEATDKILDLFKHTKSNKEFLGYARNTMWQ